MITSFPPIVNEYSDILILGSIPGIKSLEANQYYAHPQNQFWKILFQVFQCPMVKDYETRRSFLLQQHIALWDVIYQCERKGSLDSQINSVQINNFTAFYKQYPRIRAVFFNGTKARNIYRQFIGFSHEQISTFHLLPSTSPARAIPFQIKLNEWKKIIDYAVLFS